MKSPIGKQTPIDKALRENIQNWQERLLEMLRDAMLDKARGHLTDGQVTRYAAEVAEHRRDPYTLVEEIVGKLESGKP